MEDLLILTQVMNRKEIIGMIMDDMFDTKQMKDKKKVQERDGDGQKQT